MWQTAARQREGYLLESVNRFSPAYRAYLEAYTKVAKSTGKALVAAHKAEGSAIAVLASMRSPDLHGVLEKALVLQSALQEVGPIWTDSRDLALITSIAADLSSLIS